MNITDDVVAEYDYYTLDQARKIIAQEERHKQLVKEFWEHRRKEEKKRRRKKKRKELAEDILIAVLMLAPFFAMGLHWLCFGY